MRHVLPLPLLRRNSKISGSIRAISKHLSSISMPITAEITSSLTDAALLDGCSGRFYKPLFGVLAIICGEPYEAAKPFRTRERERSVPAERRCQIADVNSASFIV